jgi:hypothetical protein
MAILTSKSGASMILVNVKDTWTLVQKGMRSPAEATLGRWYEVADAAISEYGDAVAGVYRGRVVTVFDTDYTRHGDKRVTFVGPESTRWAHLVGCENLDP